MADRNGSIGRAPSDSAVTVARQTFSPTGVTTDFTFASGYTSGYFDVFVNGVKMIEGSDYTSTDGSTFSILNGGADSGDVIEGVAYKAFNAATATVGISSAGSPISTQANTLNFIGTGNTFALRGSTIDISISGSAGAGGTFGANSTGIHTTKSVGIGTTTATGAADPNNTAVLNVGIVTANNFFGSGAGITAINASNISSGTLAAGRVATLNQNTTGTAALAEGLTGTPNITVGNITASSGDLTVRNITGVAATFTGVLTYEDVTSVDSVGIVTARGGVELGAAGVGGTFSATGFGSLEGGLNVAGVVTATSYEGSGANLTGISVGLSTAAAAVAGIVTTLDLSSAQDHKITVSGISTVTVKGGTEGESHTVRIINSGITTVGFSTFFLFPSGADPSMPTADGAISLISFTVNRVGAGGTQLLAGAALNYS